MPLKGSQLCHVDGGNLRSLACAKWDVIIKVSQGLFCTRDQEPWEKKYDLGFLMVTVDGPTPCSSKVSKCVMSTAVTYGVLHVPRVGCDH